MSSQDSIEITPQNTFYGYIPSLGVAIVFIVLFSISTLGHIFQAVKWKTWFMIVTAVFCGALEILGWSGRAWAHYRPAAFLPFQIQIVATIIGPTPLLAANFVIFGRIIRLLGTTYSHLTPRFYTIMFSTFDTASLIVQAIGGAKAAQGRTLEEANRGGRIMLGGIAFQLAIITLYCILAVEYMVRYFKDKPVRKLAMKRGDFLDRGELTKNIRIMLAGLALNSVCLFIRAVYRTIELEDGWTGRIIHTQLYFNVLDGAMVTLAIYTFNFTHPGPLLGSETGKRLSSETGLVPESPKDEHDGLRHTV